jgi:YebC/PmpR family DNA-binding regulatory protein
LEGVNFEDITYEGYGPGGVAILVETLTDNRNRTIGEVRHAFSKWGGNLAAQGAVSYLFSQVGQIQVQLGEMDDETLMMAALEAGAADVEGEGDDWTVTTDTGDVDDVRERLEADGVVVTESQVAQVASLTVQLSGKDAVKAVRLIDKIEDLDDVQNVWSNFDIDDETAAMLEAE